jgi:hypothetical protein
MKTPLKIALLGMLLVLQACASLGLAPAETLSQRISYAYSQNTALRTAAANALNAGQLKVDDARYVLAVTDNGRTLLDASKAALLGGDISTAEGRLILALNILDTLQGYLNSKVKS